MIRDDAPLDVVPATFRFYGPKWVPTAPPHFLFLQEVFLNYDRLHSSFPTQLIIILVCLV